MTDKEERLSDLNHRMKYLEQVVENLREKIKDMKSRMDFIESSKGFETDYGSYNPEDD